MKKIVKLCAAAIISGPEGILLVQRNTHEIPEIHEKWEFPVGEHKFGESLEETVVRGVKEETNLNVKPLWLYSKIISSILEHNNYKINSVISYYYCAYLSGELKIKDRDIKDMKWVAYKELRSHNLAAPLREILPMIELHSLDCQGYSKKES